MFLRDNDEYPNVYAASSAFTFIAQIAFIVILAHCALSAGSGRHTRSNSVRHGLVVATGIMCLVIIAYWAVYVANVVQLVRDRKNNYAGPTGLSPDAAYLAGVVNRFAFARLFLFILLLIAMAVVTARSCLAGVGRVATITAATLLAVASLMQLVASGLGLWFPLDYDHLDEYESVRNYSLATNYIYVIFTTLALIAILLVGKAGLVAPDGPNKDVTFNILMDRKEGKVHETTVSTGAYA